MSANPFTVILSAAKNPRGRRWLQSPKWILRSASAAAKAMADRQDDDPELLIIS
jgi:hypothetical protein